MTHRWMIYGATGYTGRLIAEEAVKRGHKPILAGRDARKLQSMAESLGLDSIAFGIPDSSAALRGLQRAKVDLVLHCAGPFIHTVEPMLKACIHTETHYLDIAGEIAVLERVFSDDAKARISPCSVMTSGV
jgi:saccharopine dehydrogenase (NAD+, L-lysine-forming)